MRDDPELDENRHLKGTLTVQRTEFSAFIVFTSVLSRPTPGPGPGTGDDSPPWTEDVCVFYKFSFELRYESDRDLGSEQRPNSPSRPARTSLSRELAAEE